MMDRPMVPVRDWKLWRVPVPMLISLLGRLFWMPVVKAPITAPLPKPMMHIITYSSAMGVVALQVDWRNMLTAYRPTITSMISLIRPFRAAMA